MDALTGFVPLDVLPPEPRHLEQSKVYECFAISIFHAIDAKIRKSGHKMINPVDALAMFTQNVHPEGKTASGMLNGIGVHELVEETQKRLSNSPLVLLGVDSGKDLREALERGDTAIFHLGGASHEIALVDMKDGAIKVQDSLVDQPYWVKQEAVIPNDTVGYIGTYIVTDRKNKPQEPMKTIEITWGDIARKNKQPLKDRIQILGSEKIK